MYPTKFISGENPLNKNLICVYEKSYKSKKLLFMLDKANYETDEEFESYLEMILNALNR